MPTSAPFIVAMTAAGLIGVASMAPVVPELMRRVVPPARISRLSMPVLVSLALVQTSLLLVLCAWAGARWGSSVHLGSRLADCVRESCMSTRSGWIPLLRALVWGWLAGALGGAVTVASAQALVRYFASVPLTARLLYGGLTEEMFVRWGVLSVVGSAIARLVHTTNGLAETGVWLAILLTNALFAAAHLPLLRAANVTAPVRAALVIFAVTLPWGWLAVAVGIEAAMVAHFAFHLTVSVYSRVRSA